MEAILVPIAMFVLIGVGIVIPIWLKSRERMKLLDVIRSISEHGAAQGGGAPPQLMAALESILQRRSMASEPSPERDMRVGAYLLAVCVAMNAFGGALYLVSHATEPAFVFTGLSAFPGFIGLTTLGFWLAARSKQNV